MLCCLLWSSAFSFIKLGYNLLGISSDDYASQILFAGCRFALAGVLTVIISSVVLKKPLIPKRKETFLHIFILSLVQTSVAYTFFYLALAKIEGSAGSVINSSGTFFCILLSALVFKSDRLNFGKIAGCILGLAGIVLINFKSLKFGFSFSGEGLMILSAICYAVSSVLIKKFSATDNPALLSGWQFFLGGVMMSAAGLLLGGRFDRLSLKSAAVIVYLALVSAVAYTLWGILLKHNEVSKITIFGFINPVGGVILSALILNEKVDFAVCTVSLVLVSAGIILVNLKKDSDIKFTH